MHCTNSRGNNNEKNLKKGTPPRKRQQRIALIFAVTFLIITIILTLQKLNSTLNITGSYYFFINLSENTDALSNSAGSASNASAILKNTFKENPYAVPGTSIALKCERLISAL